MYYLFYVFATAYVFLAWGFWWGVLGLFGLAPFFVAYDILKAIL